LVIKGVTREAIKDPHGRLYNHRHPEGFWMPGGASNTGADWVTKYFTEDLEALNQKATHLLPTGRLAYPLQQRGERFPFIAPDATGFEPGGMTHVERFAANMEGVAYIERYAYDMIEKLSGEKVQAIYTAGGASNSNTWLTIRSNVLNKPIYKMKSVSGAVGAAILAASRTHFSSLTEAAKALTLTDSKTLPQTRMCQEYNTLYLMFLEELRTRGYIPNEQYA
jgi:sugar (pentulose or hexulose) kinase